jgi:transcriptional regulator with XRE-family HTH domain
MQALCKDVGSALAIGFIALAVGTGGNSNVQYLTNREERGYKIPGVQYSTKTSYNINSYIENIEFIRKILKISTADLAILLKVSRQTIYNWKNGEPPSDRNLARIDELKNVATLLEEEGIVFSSSILKRKFMNDNSLFDIAKSDGPLLDMAHKLVSILRLEKDQRILLDKKLSKKILKTHNYGDYANPMFDE